MPHTDRGPGADAGDTARLTTGQACRAAGVTRKAIRVYEQQGLLAAPARTTSGYRLFSEADVDTLRFIRRARTLRLGIDDVAEVLAQRRAGASPCAAVRTHIAARIDEIDTTIAELQELRASLAAATDTDCTPPAADPTICPIIESR